LQYLSTLPKHLQGNNYRAQKENTEKQKQHNNHKKAQKKIEIAQQNHHRKSATTEEGKVEKRKQRMRLTVRGT
jgi:hypothetical protein